MDEIIRPKKLILKNDGTKLSIFVLCPPEKIEFINISFSDAATASSDSSILKSQI